MRDRHYRRLTQLLKFIRPIVHDLVVLAALLLRADGGGSACENTRLGPNSFANQHIAREKVPSSRQAKN